jgi:N,N'-diacetyllegionaminate synthase
MATKIIAELCQNHNGDKELLRKMIKEAAENGADYIKGQIIFSEDVTHRPRFDDGEILENGIVKTIKRPYDAEVARLSKLDLSEDDIRWFVEECIKVGAIPLITVFTRSRVSFAAGLPWTESVVKVSSQDCISYPLIEELAEAFDHLIISTGGATDEEIEKAVETITRKGKKVTLLHCVSIYPNPLSVCNLSRIADLKKYTPSVGWSDHTHVPSDGIKAAKVATLLGADYIERHFTVLPPDQSKDGPVSITPELLKELSHFVQLPKDKQREIVEKEIPEWKNLVGTPERELTHKEVLTMDYMRGRFGSKTGEGKWIYNWEDVPLEIKK